MHTAPRFCLSSSGFCATLSVFAGMRMARLSCSRIDQALIRTCLDQTTAPIRNWVGTTWNSRVGTQIVNKSFSPPQAQPKKYEFWEVFGDDYNVGKVRPQTFISILALRIQYRFPSPEFVKNLFSSPESERTPPP